MRVEDIFNESFGDYVNAIDDFSSAIQFDVNKAAYYYWRSICYTKKVDTINETADFERAIKLDPGKTADSLLQALQQKKR